MYRATGNVSYPVPTVIVEVVEAPTLDGLITRMAIVERKYALIRHYNICDELREFGEAHVDNHIIEIKWEQAVRIDPLSRSISEVWNLVKHNKVLAVYNSPENVQDRELEAQEAVDTYYKNEKEKDLKILARLKAKYEK